MNKSELIRIAETRLTNEEVNEYVLGNPSESTNNNVRIYQKAKDYISKVRGLGIKVYVKKCLETPEGGECNIYYIEPKHIKDIEYYDRA